MVWKFTYWHYHLENTSLHVAGEWGKTMRNNKKKWREKLKTASKVQLSPLILSHKAIIYYNCLLTVAAMCKSEWRGGWGDNCISLPKWNVLLWSKARLERKAAALVSRSRCWNSVEASGHVHSLVHHEKVAYDVKTGSLSSLLCPNIMDLRWGFYQPSSIPCPKGADCVPRTALGSY